LMLSPSDEECPEDLRAMTYRAMRELARNKGQPLAWIAVEHRNTDQPHIHIILAGGTGTRDLRLDRADHARLKAAAVDYCRLEARIRGDWDRALAAASRDESVQRDARELIGR